MYSQSMFWAKLRKISKQSSENHHFYSLEIMQYIHGRVCVMRMRSFVLAE